MLLNALSLSRIVLKITILFVLKDFIFQFLFSSLRGSILFPVIRKLFFHCYNVITDVLFGGQYLFS